MSNPLITTLMNFKHQFQDLCLYMSNIKKTNLLVLARV